MRSWQLVTIVLILVILTGLGFFWSGISNFGSGPISSNSCPKNNYAYGIGKTGLLSCQYPIIMTNVISSSDCTVTSSSYVNAGFNMTFTASAASELITIIFSIYTAAYGYQTGYVLYYGTGPAPNCDATYSGTGITGQYVFSDYTNFTVVHPFSITGIATNLTPSTTYWVDLVVRVFTSGQSFTYENAQFSGVSE